MSDDQFRQLIANGVAKINYYTALSDLAGLRMRDNSKNNSTAGYPVLTKGIKEVISLEVERCMYLWGSVGRATEILDSCSAWTSVEHLIIYNVTNVAESKMKFMMDSGQKILSAIPGVREVFVGHALKEDAAYRYTWLARFCHPAVIDSYRDHPSHVTFADECFRPIAADRISIDYKGGGPH